MIKVYKNEKNLFTIMVILSSLFWLGLLAGTVGTLLIIIAVMYLLYLFAHSAFISYIKGTGVAVTETQFPDLHKQVQECATKLQMPQVPTVYVLNANGMVNALATKFLRHHYVILFSELVDAFENRPQSLKFYIGHEFGHIQRGHLKWGPFLWPASLFPLLGAAYSRAREYTCDLYGLACSDNIQDAAFAMAMLAAGPGQWPKVNLVEYAKQSKATGGFWMSLHELTGTYPWLCKRMQHILASSQNASTDFPRRNSAAWFLACFVPNSGMGGLGSMIMIAYIGILAAVAIPAYQDYTLRTAAMPAFQFGDHVEAAISQYVSRNDALPESLDDVGVPSGSHLPVVQSISMTDGGFEMVLTGKPQFENQTVTYEAFLRNGRLTWTCSGGSLPAKYRPATCKVSP